ncbi:YheC/YheD family protein [Ammoniphilus sp. CFH 90114]|uniref:YheC/YheD family protein n=1 Tax=Ammoniphilus sp. CFH 90114 TaxID=2493665 RepID=UPI00100E7558|nr:YheC/YheD family protein [Ammoniphilus sp. CFH 90114]RXT08158.1 YheC/YheD family protein [Ammoniphilus sp. CFH 90114]
MYKRRYQYVVSKWAKTQLLMENEMIRSYIPETQLLTRQSLLQMLERYPFLYLKPDNGMKGKGIFRLDQIQKTYWLHTSEWVKSFSNLNQVTGMLKRLTKDNKYLIQQGVELITQQGMPIDFRLLLQKPKDEWVYSGVVGKLGEKNSITTNLACGGKAIPFRTAIENTLGLSYGEIRDLRDELMDLSFLIADELTFTYPGLRELGIDYAIDTKGKAWLIEVNTTPGHRLFKGLPNEKIYKRIIRNIKIIYSDT